jgi:hypothetical protein
MYRQHFGLKTAPLDKGATELWDDGDLVRLNGVLSASLHESLWSVLIWWSCRRESAGRTIDESQQTIRYTACWFAV